MYPYTVHYDLQHCCLQPVFARKRKRLSARNVRVDAGKRELLISESYLLPVDLKVKWFIAAVTAKRGGHCRSSCFQKGHTECYDSD